MQIEKQLRSLVTPFKTHFMNRIVCEECFHPAPQDAQTIEAIGLWGFCKNCMDQTHWREDDDPDAEWVKCGLCYGTGKWSFLPGECRQCKGSGLIDANDCDGEPDMNGSDARETQLRDYNQKF